MGLAMPAEMDRISTAVCAVVNQELRTSQRLVAAKACLAKRNTNPDVGKP